MPLLLFFSLSLLTACNSLFYIPVEEAVFQVDKERVHYSDHRLPTDQGHTLHARLFPARDGNPKGLLLHFHGNSENLTAHFSAFHWLTLKGWDYLIFDYSGYGTSGGKPSREQLRKDGITALEFAWDSIPSSKKRFVVAGQSLGGAVSPVALAGWPLRDSVDLLILDATFPNYRTAVKSILDDSWAWWLKPLVRIGITEEEAPEKIYQEIASVPTLVTHCEDDVLIDISLGKEVFTGLTSPSAFWISPECGHIGFFSHWMPLNRAVLIDLLDQPSLREAIQGPFADFHAALLRVIEQRSQ